MKKQIDVTQEYIKKATPKQGRLLYEDDYDKESHKEEVNLAKWLLNTFGGEIILLSESGGTFGAKRSDFEWRGRYWELKTLKSEKSIDSALRKAISQIYDKPGGVILDFGNNKAVSMAKIESAVKSRIEVSCRFNIDVMVIRFGKIEKVFRYK